MATTPAHGAIPATACLAVTIVPFGFTPTTIGVAALASVFLAYHSMQPDVIGIKGGSARGDWWEYNSAHFGRIAEMKRQLPWWRLDKWLYLFHLWYDQFFHRIKPPYGWKPIGYVYELVQDVVLFALLKLMIGWFGAVSIALLLGLYVLIVKLDADKAKRQTQ